MVTESKSERLAARVSPELKALIQQAAGARGLSVTDFVVNSARDAAVKTLRDQQIVLSARDGLLFANAILEPGQPKARLRETFQRHRDVLGGR